MSPPMTTAAGLSRLMAIASTSPSSRPLSRSSPRAVGSPCSASATRSRRWPTSWPDSRARATSAQPPASVSRQPVAPQRHGQPGGGVDLGVPDLAGGAEVAAEHPTVGDDAEAETGRGLDDQHVVEGGGAAQQLGAGQHVGVVADEERRVRDLVEVRRQLDAVPAGHHRRADADARARGRGCRAGSGRRRAPAARHAVEQVDRGGRRSAASARRGRPRPRGRGSRRRSPRRRGPSRRAGCGSGRWRPRPRRRRAG